MKALPFNEGPARAARDVAPGTSWAFKEHRSMAEIMAPEDLAAHMAYAAQGPIEPGRLVFVAGVGIGRFGGTLPCGCCVIVTFPHIDGVVTTTPAMVFPLPEPLAAPACAFAIVGSRA